MGDPRRAKKKFETPSHPWQGDRIREEKELMIKYGLKNKKEVWKAQSYLRNLRAQARNLQARMRTEDEQALKETDLLLKKCYRIGFLPEGAPLTDVLTIDVETILSRRLQTLVYNKGLSMTPHQARQMIVHGHISISERRNTVPGMLVPRAVERAIDYAGNSPFGFEEHPMRPQGTAEGEEAPTQVPNKVKIEVKEEEGGEK